MAFHKRSLADDIATNILVDSLLGIKSSKFTGRNSFASDPLDMRRILPFITPIAQGSEDAIPEAIATLLAPRHIRTLGLTASRSLSEFLQRFRPDCQWEIAATKRFGADSDQGMVLARKDVQIGHDIERLSGEI